MTTSVWNHGLYCTQRAKRIGLRKLDCVQVGSYPHTISPDVAGGNTIGAMGQWSRGDFSLCQEACLSLPVGMTTIFTTSFPSEIGYNSLPLNLGWPLTSFDEDSSTSDAT